jgi:hypothetical protein
MTKNSLTFTGIAVVCVLLYVLVATKPTITTNLNNILAGGGGSSTTPPPSGGSFTLIQKNSTEDTFIYRTTPNTNYGDTYPMTVSANTTYDIGRGFLKFDISDLGSVNILNATLDLWIDVNSLDDATEGFNASIFHYYNQTWDDLIPTWTNYNTESNYNLTPLDKKLMFGGVGEPSGFISFNVTDAVKIAYANSNANVSFLILATDVFGTPSVSDVVQFQTFDYSIGFPEDYYTIPTLNITYTTV